MLLPFMEEGVVEAGCDEAGRGCLAGDVFAAAVILPGDFRNELLNDSKQLNVKERYLLREIIEKEAVCWSVGVATHEEIDRINILNASILAMHRALEGLKIQPQHIIVDGNRFRPYRSVRSQTVVKGDGKFMSIAAASVLAKTYRDDYMDRLDAEFPEYGWKKNKGYPTKQHREAIMKHGVSPYHRLSFTLVNDNPLGLDI